MKIDGCGCLLYNICHCIQIGAALRDSGDASWRSHSQAETEDEGHPREVGVLIVIFYKESSLLNSMCMCMCIHDKCIKLDLWDV